METAFKLSKERIIELIIEGVASFNVDLVTCLSTDYSKQGMGWILQQKTCPFPGACANMLCRWMEAGASRRTLLQPG